MTRERHIGGFWSYVHHDDEHENGRITRLRERLERSIRFFSGDREFRIFQDRKDIGWGQKWAKRLTDSVDDALLLFPVVTPSYFASLPCREEALAFRNRQEALARDDLILPIYYLTAAHVEDAGHAEPGETEVAALLRAHQYEDWRTLRDTPETDPVYAKAIERLAQKAVETLNRASPTRAGAGAPPSPSMEFAPQPKGGAQNDGGTPAFAESARVEEAVDSSSRRAEPGLIVALTVNPMPVRAQFTTISEAISRAPAGARIMIAPGHYRESLVIDKPLELIGDGLREDIIVEAEGNEALLFDTNIGVVRNLTFRQIAKDGRNYCVWVKQGRLELEDCDLSSAGLSCLAVVNSADPRVRRNRIHGGKEAGIVIKDSGRGTYEDNEIFENTLAGIEIKGSADPVVRRNRIFDGIASGIFIHNQARGTLEDNEIFGNMLSGIEVSTEAEPIVRRNHVHDGRQNGIMISEKARGTFEDNEIFGNAYSGMEIKTEAEPVVRQNRIRDGRRSGIFIHSAGRGTFENNQIVDNQTSGIDISSAGNPIVRGNTITGNGQADIRIKKEGSGTFENNELGAGGKAWDINPAAEPKVKRNRNREI